MTTLGTGGGAADVAAHMVMPVLVLSVSMAGTNIRYIRSAMLEILQQDYLRTCLLYTSHPWWYTPRQG